MNKEEDFQKDKLLQKKSFSADELAAVGLPGLPKTPRRLRDVLKVSGWQEQTQRSRGRGGLRYEFEPPTALLTLIYRKLRGETVTEAEVRAAQVEPKLPVKNAIAATDRYEQAQDRLQEALGAYKAQKKGQVPVQNEDEEAQLKGYEEWAGKVNLKNYRPLRYYRDISLSAGHGAVNHEIEEPEALLFSIAWLRSMGLKPNNLLLAQVKGDSMLPTLQPGWTVMIDNAHTRVTSGIYAITLGGEEMVKRLQRRPGGVVRVISDNPAYESYEINDTTAAGDGFSVIGRVVWHAGAMP